MENVIEQYMRTLNDARAIVRELFMILIERESTTGEMMAILANAVVLSISSAARATGRNEQEMFNDFNTLIEESIKIHRDILGKTETDGEQNKRICQRNAKRKGDRLFRIQKGCAASMKRLICPNEMFHLVKSNA